MNKYLTFAGTQPVYLGDIDFIQNASSQVQNLLLRALLNSASGTANSILQGVEFSTPSAGTIAWTAGVVALGGEVLPIEAGSLTGGATPISISDLFFHVSSTLSGSRTFKDGTSHDCFDTRVAVINTTSSGGVAVSSVERFHKPSDDAVYVGTPSAGSISAGKLYRKSGMWVLDVNMTISAAGMTQIGIITFFLSYEHSSAFHAQDFFVQVVLNNSGTYATELLKVEVTRDSANDAVIFDFQSPGASGNVNYGSGSVQELLPL